ncbi:hypothetical protein [Clostridium arbusti]|nr:hypothetical protein [Clostridium arbusti]
MENRKKEFCYDASTIDECLELVDKGDNIKEGIENKTVVQKKN